MTTTAAACTFYVQTGTLWGSGATFSYKPDITIQELAEGTQKRDGELIYVMRLSINRATALDPATEILPSLQSEFPTSGWTIDLLMERLAKGKTFGRFVKIISNDKWHINTNMAFAAPIENMKLQWMSPYIKKNRERFSNVVTAFGPEYKGNFCTQPPRFTTLVANYLAATT